ncbi:hypothetical protein Dda_1139 [Drechslerella dactyloides]|uniref:Uncharacterized protein n=1 Tax=Drechslerella dactyloides TaxID=74499 RepID=A0AAD6NN67_DREDA|nr:hypothetical protein Dda_1139 [Drechslerella dactyloides]
MTMHRARSHMTARCGWDAPRGDHSDMTLAAAGNFAEVFKNLFLPFHLHDSYGENTSSHAMQYLQRVWYTRDDTRKVDLSALTPHGARFSVVFDNGDRDPSSGPYLSVRLDQLQGSSRLISRASRIGGARSNTIGEAYFPLTDVKSVMIRRHTGEDYLESEGYPGYLSSEEDYIYEVTLRLYPSTNYYSNSQGRRFIPGACMYAHTTTSNYLKDLARRAETVKFQIKAPAEAWTCLRRLQRDLGLREERHNSSHAFYYDLEHILRARMRDREVPPLPPFYDDDFNFAGLLGGRPLYRGRGYEGRGVRRYGYDYDYC